MIRKRESRRKIGENHLDEGCSVLLVQENNMSDTLNHFPFCLELLEPWAFKKRMDNELIMVPLQKIWLFYKIRKTLHN
jgi:hypothetical protein